uniref:Phosphoinositide phospholipase C n=1 Tax=Globodera pallida TaxID=36090 RepID=A0A183C4W4_GLOPA
MQLKAAIVPSFGEGLGVGAHCIHNACKKVFTGPESDAEECCVHHPGTAVFHEGLKFWSCCERKTTDFGTFLDQSGCSRGKHCWRMKECVSNVREDWFQRGGRVHITIYCKGALPGATLVQTDGLSLEVSIQHGFGNAQTVKSYELFGEILPAESAVEISERKVEIMLKQVAKSAWPRLCQLKSELVQQINQQQICPEKEDEVIMWSGLNEPAERYTSKKPLLLLRVQISESALEAIQTQIKAAIGKENGPAFGDDLGVGAHCIHNACKKVFTGPESDAEECVHHPGTAVFHEGLKFWSCCERKTTDFGTFLDQSGCSRGKHCWRMKECVSNVREDWFQRGGRVHITIYCKGALPGATLVQTDGLSLGLAVAGAAVPGLMAYSSRRAHSSCSLGSSFQRDGHNSAKNTKNKHFLRVDHGGSSRLSKRVHIRRSSSVEIPRPKRFSSGAKELRKERNRKRLGTDTSSGSSKSKKTNSSTTSSVQKHLPKYITNLFRGRMGTDPCKRHTRGSRESSPESPMSGSETVLEFTKKLQNAPPTRRDTMRMAYKQSGKQDSAGTAGSVGCGGEQRTRHVGYGHVPELEVNSASPPRSPLLSVALVAAAVTVEGGSGSFPGATSMSMGQGGVADMRRPSSPPVLPGLPLIEIRRPSALSQFEFGYFVNSPEIVSASRGGSGAGSTDDCAPLLLSGGSTAQICSRKSSDESSMCGWSSRASSRMSQRSSSGGLRLSTFSGGTSIASDNSGPFIFSFAMQRALRMPQCRVVPFFGTFLYDLYSIVNDLPNILIIGHDGETEKLKFLHDLNGEDHFSSKIGVGGLLNVDKINLVCLILDNLEVFHRHHRNLGNYVQPNDCLANGGFVAANDANNINNGNNNNSNVPNMNAVVLNGAGNAIGINLSSTSNAVHHQPQQQPQTDTGGIGTPKQSTSQQPPEPKLYEPVQQIIGAAHGVTLIPLNTTTFDLDMIQRVQHGTTVIHYDPDSGRSVLCRLRLDAACANVVWQRIFYGREKEMIAVAKASANLQAVEAAAVNRAQTSLSPRPYGAALVTLDEGFLNTSYIKAIELVDSYDLDIEAIYRRHSVEEMSVPVECWTINFGCSINDNEFLYFLAPQQIAHYWMGLDKVVKRIQDQMRNPDRRVLWLKRLYLQLWSEQEHQRGEVISSSGGSSTGGAPLVAGSSYSPCPPPVCSPSAGPVPASSAADFPLASRRLGPRPVDALQAFGGRVEKWKTLGVSQSAVGPPYSPHGRPIDSSPSTEGGGRSKSRLRQMTIAVTRRVKRSSNSRDCSRSTSPAPQSPMVRPPSIRSQLSSQSGPPGPHSPLPYLLKPRSGFESAAGTALSEAGDLDSLYTPRSRTPTTSSYGGRSVGGRSIKSWRSRGGETPNSGSISSSGGGPMSGALLTTSGKEYQERPITFTEFVELFRLFSTRMRKDLKDLFQDFVIAAHSSANSHVPPKRATSADCKSSCSPRVQSRLESMSSYPACNEFVPDDILTRNSAASHICQLNDKQQKIYNALALASVCSSAPMDTSRNSFLTPAALKQFICTQQMEYVDEQYAQKLIQEHEPDPTFRAKQLLSFEGFVRFLCDPINYAFVPEQIKPSEDQLQHPLSYYYICSSHNTYLIGHQLKGESSTEMYRQVLQTGCRCVELDCWDGDDGLPLIYHGHTLTTKIGFRQVVDVIKTSCFGSSDLPVILSIENHCSLQQQSKMAQMFRTAFGDRLVTSFLFDSDYSDCPQLPSPWQLRNKIIIKNKKMIVEPSAGIYTTQIGLDIHGPGDLLFGRGGAQMSNLCSEGEIMDIAGSRKGSYESSTIDDVDEDDELDQYLDEEEDDDVPTETDVETRTEAGGISPLKMHMIPIIKTSLSSSSNRRPSNESMNSFVSDRTRVVPLSHMAGAISSIASPHASRRILLEGGGGNLCDVERKKSEREFPSLRRHPRGGHHTGLGRRGSNFTTTTAAITRASNNGNQIAPELSDLSVKFKGFVVTTLEVPARDTPGTSGTVGGAESVGLSSGELRPCSNSFAGTLRMRSYAPSMLSSYSATVPSGPSTGGTAQPRRLKSSSQTAVSVAEPTNCLQANAQPSDKNGTDGDIPQQSQQHLQLLPGSTISMSGGQQQHTQTTQNGINSTKNSNSSSSKGIASPNSKASCYQVSSLTEASARKLCRKHPQKCISYTRNHIMRTYPGGMRIDSSNFNPQQLLEFWQCGLQMVALNYQTADVAMAVNTAMFEQFGNCGYMLKPRALWDASHPLFGKFNPFSKELNLCPALILQLTIISGQYVQNPAGPSPASPFLEIEVIGVPADCAKEKSKMVGRNGVNPVWNHSCTFRIVFAELAFIRVAVCDGAANGRVMAQRVVAVRCLRPGYRHLPLRTPGNQPLEQSFLFVRTRFEQEEHIYLHDEDLLLHFAGGSPLSAQHSPHSACSSSHPLSHHSAHGPSGYESELIYQVLKLESDANVKPLSILRRQIFIIRIIGLLPDDTPTIVHAESSSTVRSIIQMALANAGKAAESADDYVLFEESVQQPLRSPSSELPLQSVVPPLQNLAADFGGEGTSFAPIAATEVQRMLPHCEPILDAVACWNGSTRRFHLRKRNADACGRAGLFSSIIKSSQPSGALGGAPSASTMSIGPSPPRKLVGHSLAGGDQQQPNKSQSSSQLHGRSIDVVEASGGGGERLEPGMHPRAKSMGETFLVCVHNISDTHPYAILRTSINNTARDIIKQIFAKTQCYDVELDEYALVEEVVVGQQRVEPKSDKGIKQQAKFRVLEPEENIWKVQSRWSGSSGRFLLERRDQKSNKRVKSPLFYSSMPSCCLMPTIFNNMAAPFGTGPSASPILSASASVPSSARPDEASGGGPLAPLRKISLSSVRSIQIPKLRNARFGKSLTLDGGGQNRHKDSMERN